LFGDRSLGLKSRGIAMAKKKTNKNLSGKPKEKTKKPNELTSLELAFQKAISQQKSSPQKETPPPANATTQERSKNRKIFSQTQQKDLQQVRRSGAHESATTPAKERTENKRIYTPSRNAQSKPQTLQRTGTTHEKNMPKQDKTSCAPEKLHLKRLPDEEIMLDAGKTGTKKEKTTKGNKGWKKGFSSKTQAHDGNPNAESDIVIGFDFGTSSSKLVFRDTGRQTAYAVPFGSMSSVPENIYLLPTYIYINDEGELNLTGDGHYYTNLKVDLIKNAGKPIFKMEKTGEFISASELATAYMGIVLEFAKDWFLNHTKTIYQKTQIQWSLNLGIPSKNYDDTKEEIKMFRIMAMSAWRLSVIDAAVKIYEVKKAIEEAKNHIKTQGEKIDIADENHLWLHPDFVNVHPEVIMEIVGYSHSPLRKEGLHLLVDVGATTLDAAAFVIHNNEGEDIYPLLETDVQTYGTIALHQRRMDSIKNNLQKSLWQINAIDPLKPVPEISHYGLSIDCNTILAENDAAFFIECSKIIGEVIRRTKLLRDPNSRAWERELDVFICGGGARLVSYRKMVEDRGNKIADRFNEFKGFNIKEIPISKQLDAPEIHHNEYDRLAVAYGLSFSVDEIGKIIPSKQIKDVQRDRKTKNCQDQFIDKDMC